MNSQPNGELGVRLQELGTERRFIAQAVANQTCEKSAKRLAKDAERFAEADLQLSRKHPGIVHLSFLKRIQLEPKWKREIREFLAARLTLVDSLLSPWCAMGELLNSVSFFRSLGLRALQVRCGLHWYGRLLQLMDGDPRL